MVADIEELDKMDASEIHAWRLNAKEVISPKFGEHFVFPIADGKVKLSQGDRVLRTSTLIRDHPERGEVQEDLFGESDGCPPTTRQDSQHDEIPLKYIDVTRATSTTLDVLLERRMTTSGMWMGTENCPMPGQTLRGSQV